MSLMMCSKDGQMADNNEWLILTCGTGVVGQISVVVSV